MLPISSREHEDAFRRFSSPPPPKRVLDIALVIDTTGSMSDELRYLQVEFMALSRTIERAHPDAQQRWAIVVYRDVGDEYALRDFDFRSSAEQFRYDLAAQSASGGGDFPESPELALEKMMAPAADPHLSRGIERYRRADGAHDALGGSADRRTLPVSHR